MGPLLYHFADLYGQEDVSFISLKLTPIHAEDIFSDFYHDVLLLFILFFLSPFPLLQEMSIELSLEDVKRVALHYGFEFEVNLGPCFSVFC